MDKKYSVIEFKGSLEVAVVCAKWLTPRKKEVFWPPYKENGIFMRALKKQEELDPKIWKLHVVERIFHETGKLTFNVMAFLLRYSNQSFLLTPYFVVFFIIIYIIFLKISKQ
jgi:hypothetical protein